MIQRIQSLYLFMAGLVSLCLPFLFPLWINANKEKIWAIDTIWIFVAFMVSALISWGCILMYKNRKNQFVLNRLNMILNLFLLGFFVFTSLSLSGETAVSEKGIGMLTPIFSIVFLVLANRAIKRDEDLVKSVDRLR